MKNWLVIIIALLLASCDPAVDFSQVVYNDSNHDIWIKPTNFEADGYVSASLYTQDSFLIPANSQSIIFNDLILGDFNKFSDCHSPFPVDTFITRVANNDTLMVLVNMANYNNWIFVPIEKRSNRSGQCECRLIIRNSDVQ